MISRRRVRFVLLLLGVALVVPWVPWSAAPAGDESRPAISRSGMLDDASYLIEVPANWRGGLVVFAHGIQRGPGRGDVRFPPIASHITGAGHAWIASGYRAREYQPHLFIDDLVALRELFLREIGMPRWSIISGQSMGGHIVVKSLELRPDLYQGGLAECGAVDGIGVADYLLAYTAAAALIGGVPLLDAPDRAAFGPLLADVVRALGQPGSYTARGRQFDSVVKYLIGRRSGRSRAAAPPAGTPGALPAEPGAPSARRRARVESRPPCRHQRARQVPHRSRPGAHGGRAQRPCPAGTAAPGCPLAERQPRLRRADGPAHRAADHAARDG